jgi:hypothetical protein
MYLSTILRATFVTIFLSTVLAQTPTTMGPVMATQADETINFGSCASPEITFSGTGMFSVLNPSSYLVGSNSNIAPLLSFIVQALNTTCGANSWTVGLAAFGEASVVLLPQGPAQADSWNAGFGIDVNSHVFRILILDRFLGAKCHSPC